MKTHLSHHAEIRAQQRGLPPVIVEWLLEFGTVTHDHHGAEIHHFDKKGKKRLASAVGDMVVERLTPLLDAYVVTKGDTVVTVGHRYKRINQK